MRVEILGIGIDLVAIDEFALLSDPNVTGEVAARQIVAGALRADDALAGRQRASGQGCRPAGL